jgi:DNA mismatch repair protein MutS
LRFARACNPGAELPVRRIGSWDPSTALVIDPVAQAHLELVHSVAGLRGATLLGVIDATRTAAGARLLRRRLLAPLTSVERIRRRLDLVELFVVHVRLRDALSAELEQVGDLERLAVRASLGEATPRDLGALRDGLAAAEKAVHLLDAVEEVADRETLGLAEQAVDTVDDLRAALERALVERPPALAKDGSVFRAGYDRELDEHDSLRRSGTERMVELEAQLREQTAITNLKVRYTRVFGWYIEVTRAHAGRAPGEWRRKQTVATGERYTTPELDDLADRILHAEENHRERELLLLREVCSTAARASERVRALSGRLARWDVAAALADVAHRYDYARPSVDASDAIEIRDGRHPVVERLAAAGRFVPNDVSLDLGGDRLWLVTGPNMAGKSTLLRQVALSVILAQMGAYVPARAARIGVVDRVLSRVGASDNLARGESTFMVEMRETAEILRSATRRSLVILDEIGRGTSTFDGLAIAWAVAEYLDEVIGCRALFATHYHELTALAESSDHVANYSVSARELQDDVVFLHRLVAGPASRSYGVAVAKLAGLPESVLARARAVLATLESGGAAPAAGAKGLPHGAQRANDAQLDLFAPGGAAARVESEIVETLRGLDVDRLTPLEALQLLARLKQRL